MKKVDKKQFAPLFLGHEEKDGYYLSPLEWRYAYEKGLLSDGPSEYDPEFYKWFKWFRDRGFYVKEAKDHLRIYKRGFRPDRAAPHYVLFVVKDLDALLKALDRAIDMRKRCLVAVGDKLISINYFNVEPLNDEG